MFDAKNGMEILTVTVNLTGSGKNRNDTIMIPTVLLIRKT